VLQFFFRRFGDPLCPPLNELEIVLSGFDILFKSF